MPASLVALLRVVKVRRHSDDRFRHLLAEIVFGRLLQLLQDHAGDLGRSVLLPLRDNYHVVAVPLYLVRDHLQFFDTSS